MSRWETGGTPDIFLPCIAGGAEGKCGEDGANLSGGQKQRIALARALIRGIDFMILDEGVSAIDVESANEIEQELLDMKNLTLLTITHRIKDGLLPQYDRILYMDGGRLYHMNPGRPQSYLGTGPWELTVTGK